MWLPYGQFHQSLVAVGSGNALGIWICGCRLFFKGGSKGGYQGGNWKFPFFTQAKVSKVLNLDFQFFCIDFLGLL